MLFFASQINALQSKIRTRNQNKRLLTKYLDSKKVFSEYLRQRPPVINGDQMPLHINESASQKMLSLKSDPSFIKESYMLSRERVTYFT